MPQLTIRREFLYGQQWAFKIARGETKILKEYKDSKTEVLIDLIYQILDLDQPDSITHHDCIENILNMLENIALESRIPPHHKLVLLSVAWTLISQVIQTNEFLVDDFGTKLRTILGYII